MKEFETHRDQMRKITHAPLNAGDLKEAGIVRDLSNEVDRACRLLREGTPVPSLEKLLQDLIPRYMPKDTERVENIIEGTIRVVRRWKPPEKIGNVVPDPRVAAMDSVTQQEASELRELWKVDTAQRPTSQANERFRLLLISCRALLFVEKHPDMYRIDKKSQK